MINLEYSQDRSSVEMHNALATRVAGTVCIVAVLIYQARAYCTRRVTSHTWPLAGNVLEVRRSRPTSAAHARARAERFEID